MPALFLHHEWKTFWYLRVYQHYWYSKSKINPINTSSSVLFQPEISSPKPPFISPLFHCFRFYPSLLSSHYPCILNFMKLHITFFWEARRWEFSFLIPLSPPRSLILRQKAFYVLLCFLLVLHVEMLPRPDWGSTHIVYEKQKDDDVMSCLDSMQMNTVHKNLS